MKTVIKLLVIIICLINASGCKDDHIYPSPLQSNKYQKNPSSELYIVINIPLNSEFTVTFTKQSYLVGDPAIPELGKDLYWLGVELNDQVYVMEMEGTGENPLIGRFNIHISSTWLISYHSGCSTSARIMCGNDGYFDLIIKDDVYDLTSEYPSNAMLYEKTFKVTKGEGLFYDCEGSGDLTFIVSETIPDVMTLKFNGTLKLVIAR